MRYIRKALSIDMRSLAALRIALGLMLLIDLTARAGNLTAHYTDAGVFPRALRIELDAAEAASGENYHWSLHMLSGERWAQAAMFALAGGGALAMLAGYRTRLATIVSLVMTVSLQTRNPLVADAGDLILKCLLFWSMFLPLGAAASFDRLLRPDDAPPPKGVFSAASAALLLQVCMIYWSTAAEKHDPIWTRDYTALYYTLSLDTFAKPLAHWLLQFPRLLVGLTAVTYWAEWLGPVLALAPLFKGGIRAAVALFFCLLHLGTAITMELGLLPWIAMTAWLPFLPGGVWDRLAGLISRFAAARGRLGAAGSSTARHFEAWLGRPAAPYAPAGRLTNCLVVLLLAYTAVWNVNRITKWLDGNASVPRQWKTVGIVTGLEQAWPMFAPYPMTSDGWFVMKGVLADGAVVNLWQPGEPLPWRKPASVRTTFRGRRWAKYLQNLLSDEYGVYIPGLAAWLRRRWNQEFAGNSPDRRVRSVEIVYQIEETLSPGRKSSLVTPYILWRSHDEPPDAPP
ncbi:MAG TPA: HTTM domain-containing protein [Pirellulales bacterium]|nr:HTTM domain-containing protein [Pirellulales bacterium]